MHNPNAMELRVDGNADVRTTTPLMPRADDCRRCSKPAKEHVQIPTYVEGSNVPTGFVTKCLFDAMTYEPLSRFEYINKFNSWSYGKRIEDLLADLAYVATGGTKVT